VAAATTSGRIETVRVAVLTVSTSKAAGSGEDESGPRLAALARELGAHTIVRDLVGDDRCLIEERLRVFADEGCALVLTTGGTGLSGDDVTPEATLAVLHRQTPGIAEAMRLASRTHTDYWMLSRGVAGVRGGTLIVNFPGNPRAIDQVARDLLLGLRHALEVLRGTSTHPSSVETGQAG
jgi:molybdopterin adenylyltransferase